MDLANLENYLKTLGTSFTLNATDAHLPAEFQQLLASMPGGKVVLTPGANGITLQDTTLSVTGSTTDTWPVQGLNNLTLSLSSLAIRIDNSGAAPELSAQAHATLPITASINAQVVVSSQMQADQHPWQITLAQPQPVLSVTPSQWLLLGRANTLPFNIPSQLKLLEQMLTVNPAGVQITFYPNSDYEMRYFLQLSAPQAQWTLITDVLSFNGIDLNAFLMTNSISVRLTGHILIEETGMDVAVGLDTSGELLAFLKPTQGTTFPGLAALAKWIGGNTLADTTATGFSNVNFKTSPFDAAISSVSLKFNAPAAQLTELEIISLLSLGALKLDVALRLPHFTISGNLHDGQPVKIKDMLASYGLTTDDVPDNLSIAAANFTAQPSQSFYSANLALNNIWQAGPFNLQKVSATILHYGTGDIAAQFECVLGIGANFTLDLFAEYVDQPTGWRFAGLSDVGSNLSIGDVITELAESFGIANVPQPLRALTLIELAVTYETGTGKFHFGCTGDFTVDDTPVLLTITIDVAPTQAGQTDANTVQRTKGYSARFGGQVTFSGHEFDLIFDTESTGTNVFIASYAETTAQDTINLHDLVSQVSSELANVIPASLTIELKAVKFIFFQDQSKQFSFGLNIGTSLSLSDLPLVGSKLPADLTLAIHSLQFTYNSTPFTPTQVQLINPLLPEAVAKLPEAGMTQGINLAATLQMGASSSLPLSLSNGQSSLNQPAPASSNGSGEQGTGASVAGGSTKWFNVQKQFGIFQFKRVGVEYQNNILMFALDAAMTLGPLTFSLDGLAVGSPLTEFKPTFDLTGLGLAYVQPPLEIIGALLKVPGEQLAPDVAFQYDGLAVIQAEDFSAAAIGSYAQTTAGDPSLFVFAQLSATLGGPPAFYVTGLMAGFGFNRYLAFPAQDEVLNFPLLALAQPPQPGGNVAPQDPMFVLDVLEGRKPATPDSSTKAWLTPKPDQHWLAAGLQFTSFELVQSQALLVVEFGPEFQLNLLGISRMTLPQAADSSDPYAFVEMELDAIFKPQDGFFGLTAILSNRSYVLTPACHLTGGFAFFLWFDSNPNAGQFVITLGGYHPAFKPPNYFPQVPRLGFDWAVSDKVSIKGDAYFALTTSCVMAGGALEALFQDGNLRAWFTAHMDVLISWHPFFFTAHLDVEIGVSYRLDFLFIHKTFSASIGATVDLWGPPTGGRVHVHLSFVTFTVEFGSDNAGQKNQALQWNEFKNLLPAADSVCTLGISSGLYKTKDSATSSSGKAWIVRSGNFKCYAQSAIPVNLAPVIQGEASPGINIKPMNLTGVTSQLSLELHPGSLSNKPVDWTNWTFSPRQQNVPDSLWGAPPIPFTQIPAKPSADVIASQVTGYDLQAPAPKIGASRGPLAIASLGEEYSFPPATVPLSEVVGDSTNYNPSFKSLTIAEIQKVNTSTVAQNRAQLFDALAQAQVFTGTNGTLDHLAAQAEQLFSDSPLIQADQ